MRAFWFALGVIALALGVLGVVLPLLPTTPFVLLAAFAFARSSERFHDWLLSHRIFGRLIANWRHDGAIDGKTKFVAALSMVGVFVLSVALRVPPLILGLQAVVLIAVAVFVLSRPSPPDL
ncbi:MAG: YbaN family protein [bacterium]